MTKVRFKVAWQTYKVGDEVEPPAAHGEWLVRQGFADYVKGEREVAALEEPETATHKSRRKMRRRRA